MTKIENLQYSIEKLKINISEYEKELVMGRLTGDVPFHQEGILQTHLLMNKNNLNNLQITLILEKRNNND